MMRLPVPAFLFAVLAAAGVGFGATWILERHAMETLQGDLNMARDCRKSGATLPPCPVTYRNTKIEWREKIETVEAPDPEQAQRITALTGELADARERLRDVERLRAVARAPRLTGAWWLQNGTMNRPYSTDDRCPSGTVVVFEAAPPVRGAAAFRSGDPNVCYVRRFRDTLASGRD